MDADHTSDIAAGDPPLMVPPHPAEPTEEWALCEIMGHRRHYGRITEVSRFGSTMLQIDVPTETDGIFERHLYGASSIFAITQLTEADARLGAARRALAASAPWLRQSRMPTRRTNRRMTTTTRRRSSPIPTRTRWSSEPMADQMLTRLFGKPEEINGHDRCSTYLYRWFVLRTGNAKVYIHKFVGDDWTRDLHDHPKRFISIGLWGSYLEQTPSGQRRYRAPWIRSFPATHKHRLTTPWGTCWTLVIVLKTIRGWGFWHQGQFIPWQDYVDGSSSGIADAMKDCP